MPKNDVGIRRNNHQCTETLYLKGMDDELLNIRCERKTHGKVQRHMAWLKVKQLFEKEVLVDIRWR